MLVRTRPGGVIAGISMSLSIAGCLDGNPKFTEPTGTTSAASDSGTASSGPTGSTTAPPTTGTPTTQSPTTQSPTTGSVMSDSDTEDTSTSTSGTSSSTTSQAVCGDGNVEGDEECDNGLGNADDADCTSECKNWACGDGLLHISEECEDGNGDPGDGCVECRIPRTCKQVQDLDMGAPSGEYLVDPDGPIGDPLILVACDMDVLGGGWTVVESSPNTDPIGRALFVDFPFDVGNPLAARYRMPRPLMNLLVSQSTEMHLACGDNDWLLAGAWDLFAGEMGGPSCSNFGKVLYKEAVFKGKMLQNVELCTGFTGLNDGECPGAWHIDEWEQMLCGLPEFPWNGGQMPVTNQMVDAFAVDPYTIDGPPPMHDCHLAGAVRRIMLR